LIRNCEGVHLMGKGDEVEAEGLLLSDLGLKKGAQGNGSIFRVFVF